MPPKIIIDLIKTFPKNILKKLLDPILLTLGGGNLTSLQNLTEKRLDQFSPCVK